MIFYRNITSTGFFFRQNLPSPAFFSNVTDWKLIYSDKVANIFVRSIPVNQPLIDKYPDVKPVVIDDKDEKSDEK